jgi:hypothetical protein
LESRRAGFELPPRRMLLQNVFYSVTIQVNRRTDMEKESRMEQQETLLQYFESYLPADGGH